MANPAQRADYGTPMDYNQLDDGEILARILHRGLPRGGSRDDKIERLRFSDSLRARRVPLASGVSTVRR